MDILAPNLLIASMAVVFGAAIVQGTMGMGFGQVAASGLIWIDPAMVPTAVIVMGFCVAFSSAAKEFRLINIKQLQSALIGRALGTLVSVPLLVWVGNQGQFDILVGFLVIAGIVVSLMNVRPELTNRTLVLGGTASGIMGTITSIGAPPMGLIYQDQTASEVRSTLNAFFAVGSIISLIALWFSGMFRAHHILSAAILAPGFMAGVYASRSMGGFVDSRFRPLILIFCGASAATLIAKAIWSYAL